MQILAFLLGENPNMAKAEFLANLEKQGIKWQGAKLKIRDRLFFVNTEKPPKPENFSDLALTHEVCEFLGNLSAAKKLNWRKIFPRGGVAVRAKKIPPKLPRSGSTAEKELGEIFWRQKIKVNFMSQQIARIYLTRTGTFLGRMLWQNTEPFEKRKAHLRPFVSPISMHPKFARTIVNLAHVKKGLKVLDPFCGTAGILIEAGLLGGRVFGVDIDPRLVAGAKKNLESYKINSEGIKLGDALLVKGEFDAIVTELPFGRSTRLTMPRIKLYKKFMALLPALLKKGCFAVVAVDTKELPEPKKMKRLSFFSLYVHGGMTRWFFVFKRV